MATLDKNGVMLRYIEKPGIVDKSKLYNYNRSYGATGFYFFDAHVFGCFHGKDQIKPSNRGELEIGSAYNWMIAKGYKIGLFEVDGWWKDPGNPEDMLAANRLVLSWKKEFIKLGKIKECKLDDGVEIGKGSEVVNSVIRGPVIIGENVKVKDTYIGPYTAIGNNVNLSNVSIENSIIMADCSLHDVKQRLDSCIIGNDVEVTEKTERPRSVSLFVGDDSKVIL
jgi:glucose-1-phosphate thymidylyltransferase